MTKIMYVKVIIPEETDNNAILVFLYNMIEIVTINMPIIYIDWSVSDPIIHKTIFWRWNNEDTLQKNWEAEIYPGIQRYNYERVGVGCEFQIKHKRYTLTASAMIQDGDPQIYSPKPRGQKMVWFVMHEDVWEEISTDNQNELKKRIKMFCEETNAMYEVKEN